MENYNFLSINLMFYISSLLAIAEKKLYNMAVSQPVP